MVRSAHALADEGRVWLIDPFEDEAAIASAADLGEIAGVIQLLDRHKRDGEALAQRFGVALHRLPERIADAPFEVVPVISRPGWHEVALWWGRERALVVAEAVGTAPVFAAGRRAGVHPLLRVTPPRRQLSGYDPDRLLVGHGRPIEHDGAGAVREALDRARSDFPRLLLKLPGLLRSG